MAQVAYIVKESGVTLFKDGRQYSAANDFWSFNKIIAKIKSKNFDGIENLFNTNEAIKQVQEEICQSLSLQLNEQVVICQNGEVTVGGKKIYNRVTERIQKMLSADFDVGPLSNFLIRLLKNPSKTAIAELYPFMEKANVAIDSDGFIIAYKKVRSDYFDIHSGTVNYNIGNIVEMSRGDVDDNRSNLCSDGLHFCSFSYLSKFGSDVNDRVLIVKIDPADVVSIPADYNDAKARTCRMEVIGEIDENVKTKDVLSKSPVYEKSQSANPQLSPEIVKTGTVKIFATGLVDLVVIHQIQHGISKAIGKQISLDLVSSKEILEEMTLKSLTNVYNDLVSVYNVIQTDAVLASVAMFKCSKNIAIEKIIKLSDEMITWFRG